jgi:hypothetical protein
VLCGEVLGLLRRFARKCNILATKPHQRCKPCSEKQSASLGPDEGECRRNGSHLNPRGAANLTPTQAKNRAATVFLAGNSCMFPVDQPPEGKNDGRLPNMPYRFPLGLGITLPF